MSQVSNIIVTYSVAEPSSRIEDVNLYFSRIGYERSLVSIEDPNLPAGWYGGNKPFECEVLVGAFNFLNANGFVSHLKTIPWIERNSVQVFLLAQDRNQFQAVTL